MRRYDLLSDLRDAIQACLGAGCDYRLVITRGKPPHECNLIGFWLGDDRLEQFSDCAGESCDQTREFVAKIELVRVCAAPQASVQFDFRREEDEARCFYTDLDRVECCIDGDGLHQLRNAHGIETIRRTRTRIDESTRGGAFSARLELVITADQCCETPPVPPPTPGSFTATFGEQLDAILVELGPDAGWSALDADEIRLETSEGTAVLGPDSFYVSDDSLILIPGVSETLGAGTDITRIVILNGEDVIAEWEGSISVGEAPDACMTPRIEDDQLIIDSAEPDQFDLVHCVHFYTDGAGVGSRCVGSDELVFIDGETIILSPASSLAGPPNPFDIIGLQLYDGQGVPLCGWGGRLTVPAP